MCFFNQVNEFNIQYDNINIDIVDEFKFLGYYINKNLKFKTHCDMLIKKLSSCNFILYKCCQFLPKRHLYLINNALSISYINYFNVLLTFFNKNEINKINKQLRRAGSIILNCKRYEITTLNWSFCDAILFNFQGNFIDKIRKGYYETIVDNLTLNNSKTRCNSFIVPVIKNNIDLKNFTYWIPKHCLNN